MKISSIILCIKTCVRTPNTDVCLYYTIIVIQLLSIVVFVCHYNFQHSRHCDNNLRKGGPVLNLCLGRLFVEHWNALINKSHACNEIHEQLKCFSTVQCSKLP